MYFDFQDYRPDTPRIPSAISVREGVLLSLVVHLFLVIAFFQAPSRWFEHPVEVQPVDVQPIPREREPIRFIEVVPLVEREERPVRPADHSDMDRRAATQEQAPDAEGVAPLMRGNTPEMIVGGPSTALPEPPPRPSPPQSPERSDEPQPVADAMLPPPPEHEGLVLPALAARRDSDRANSTSIADSLRNLQEYLREENFDNPDGGRLEPSANIQFDSMGVEFGPWMLRFKHHVQRNWLVPSAAANFPGHAIVRFDVLRSGMITNLQVLKPAPLPSMTNAALNALRLSNPMTPLPPEYPADKMTVTATFFYFEDPRSFRP